MKIYINKASDSGRAYCGGLAIVAANTPEEANAIIISADPYNVHYIDKEGYMCTECDEDCIGKQHNYYLLENWRELPYCNCDLETPTLLGEDSHSE